MAPGRTDRQGIANPGTAWDRRRERIAGEIERAALELFAETRPEDVTIEQIAAAAGISMRTFFRYFAGRDEVLAALPRRKLTQLSERVRSRPAGENLVEAFTAATAELGAETDDEDMILLWGVAVHRSPEGATAALTHSAVSMADVFREVTAARLGLPVEDRRAGAVAAALAGLVGFAFSQWVLEGGPGRLDEVVTEALAALAVLQSPPPTH